MIRIQRAEHAIVDAAVTHPGRPIVFDEHVGLREVADLPVEREHHAALEQDAALPLHTGEIGIGIHLGKDTRRQHRGCGGAGHEACAGLEKPAT
jgi:hypothetical protein